MVRFLIVAALTVAAAPALAAERAHTPQQVSDALKAGCSVQHVHTPAGKNGQQPAIVHCKHNGSVETASSDTARDSRKARPAVAVN